MSIITALQNQFNRDLKKQKGIVKKDSKQHFLHFDETRNVFLGIDENGEEWIAGPKTEVPCYWEYCPNNVQFVHNAVMKTKKCNKPHFVPIYLDGDTITCVECNHSWKIQINIPDTAPQKKILQEIQKEKGV